MRRFQLLVLIAAITAGVIWWSFYRSRHTSSTAITALLPNQTLAFFHLPDFNRSRSEFRQTDLYQIWTEPAVQAFLQRPRARVPANLGVRSTIQECESLQMKDLFIAVVGIEHSAWKIVGGFRFKGDPKKVDEIVTGWKTRFLRREPDSKGEILQYEGHEIQTDSAGIVRLSTVRAGPWYFMANDLDSLKPILDRLDHRVKGSDTPLALDDVFAAASKHMPSIYTALGYTRVDQFAGKLIPQPGDNEQETNDRLAAIRQIRSLCGTTSFEGGKIRDAIFVGMPKGQDADTLTRASLPVATKDAFLYTAALFNLNKPVPLATLPMLGWLADLQKIIASLSANDVTLESWNSAFGRELTWIGNWPTDSHWPSFLATLPVKDSSKARDIIMKMTEPKDSVTPWRQQEKDGVQYFSTSAASRFFMLSPTIGLSNQFLVGGADPEAVEAAMKRISSGNSELGSSRTFRISERAVPPARQMFSYVDLALLYERLDATLRPMLFMGAAFLPGIADTIDPRKLPAAEIITRHLSPIVISQHYEGDGYISESVGPITASQAIVALGGIGGAAALIYQMQTHDLASDPTPNTISIGSTSASPSPSKNLNDSTMLHTKIIP